MSHRTGRSRPRKSLAAHADLPIKVAAVGLGSVAVKRNLPILTKRAEYDVVGVIDRKGDHAAAVAKRFGCRLVSTARSVDDVPWLDEISLVCVGTGPQSHHSLIRAALLRGKDVLTEKPFTMTVKEGEELVELAAERERILAIVHNFQFATSTSRLLRDIQRGRLGRIALIVARQLSNPRRDLPAWYDELPLGLFYDESPHFFYLLSRVAPGALQFLRCEAFPSTAGRATPAHVEVKYRCESEEHGVFPVTMAMSFETGISEWHLTVFGEKALGDIDLFRDIYVRLPNDGRHTTLTTFRSTALATAQHWGQHLTRGSRHLAGTLRYGTDEVFDRLTEALITREEPRNIGASDALRTLEMQHEAIARCEDLAQLGA